MATPIRAWFITLPLFINFLRKCRDLFLQNANKECPLTKFEQFSKRSFGEIRSQRLTIYPCIWN